MGELVRPYVRVLFGAHVLRRRRDLEGDRPGEEIGGDAVQVFTQSPRMWRPTAHTDGGARALPRAPAAGAASSAVSCHALYLVNLASRDRDDPREVARRRCARRCETAGAIGAEASSSTSARTSARASRTRLERVVPALARAPRADDRRPVAAAWRTPPARAARSAARSPSSRRSSTALDRHPRLGICLDSCHWWASGVDVADRGCARRGARGARRADRPRAGARAPRQRLADAARLEPRPARARRPGAHRRGARDVPRPPAFGAIQVSRPMPRRSRAGRDGVHKLARPPRTLDGASRDARPRDVRPTGRDSCATRRPGDDPFAGLIARHAEGRALAGKLVELGVPAAEVVLAVRIRSPRPRPRTSAAAPAGRARRRSRRAPASASSSRSRSISTS